MSTQDTTLPPLPHPLLIAGGKNWFTIEQMHAYARAAIAAQAPQPGFSPMWLAPLDGTPVVLYMPTTTDKFAVGQWHGNSCSLNGNWGDDEGNYYVHTPVSFMALSNLERIANPQATVKESLPPQQAQQAQGVPTPSFNTSKAGRDQVARFFSEHLKRQDFTRYISDTLAADFACALAPVLYSVQVAAPQAEPQQKPCLVSGACKHGSWCTETYCQEHCQFVKAEPQPEREPTRLETLHAWATSGEPPCNSFDKGYEAAREFVAMQLAGIGTKGGQ